MSKILIFFNMKKNRKAEDYLPYSKAVFIQALKSLELYLAAWKKENYLARFYESS